LVDNLQGLQDLLGWFKAKDGRPCGILHAGIDGSLRRQQHEKHRDLGHEVAASDRLIVNVPLEVWRNPDTLHGVGKHEGGTHRSHP